MFRPPLCLLTLVMTVSAAAAETTTTFERDIWPILRAHCLDCHGATSELKGHLDLRLVRFAQKGGDSGPAIVPHDPDGSYLLNRIENGEMPPGAAKVTPAELKVLRAWIAAGAPTARPEPESLPPGLGITPEERAYWAFQPITRPETPTVKHVDQVRTPIDALLLARLEARNLSMAPLADRATLIRRATFDLTGLPPTYAQVQAFVNDPSPGAYERLIDDLLQSPQYGERWGRHWLDVVGYADSDGVTTQDPLRPYAYKYRDYVIRAFNADKPFDRFLIEQLAGDELVPLPHANLSPEQIDLLVATGYLRMAADGTTNGIGDQQLASNQVVADTLKIVSTSLYGLSVGCAQCHDHRYDPIPQTDYYALRAVFEPALDWQHWRRPGQRNISLYTDADRAAAAAVEAEAKTVIAERDAKQQEYIDAAFTKELEKHPEELREDLRRAYYSKPDKRTPEQQQLLKERPSANINPGNLYQYDPAAAEDLKKRAEQIEAIRQKKPVEDFVSVLNEPGGNPPPTHLFHRGDHRQPLQVIEPGDLQIASAPGETIKFPLDDPALPTTGRRLAFARWLTSGKHPLVARVLVNRIWMHHFGHGIVPTAGEFGKLGEQPSHPELLDWLATEFMSNGWSVKSLHRKIMLSYVYQQSSRRDPAQDAVDSDNRLLGRMSVRRLEAEAIRDRLLSTAGTLDLAPFGPAIPVAADDAGQIIVANDNPRRSVYLQTRRTQPVAMLTTFDAPVMDVNCERRSSSTVAGQALLLMNSEQVWKMAGQLATRARNEAAPSGMSIPAELQTQLPVTQSPWSFGRGSISSTEPAVTTFTPLGHWTGSQWQGGPQLPDADLGWVLLHATGGHTGANPQYAAIRRWTATEPGTVTVTGTLKHLSENGDGVRGRIVTKAGVVLTAPAVKNGPAATTIGGISMEPGDTIDFVTDCVENVTSDSFEWIVTVKQVDAAGKVLSEQTSSDGFHGPPGPALVDQIVAAWRLALARDPRPEELERAARFAAVQLATLRQLPAAAKKTNPPADDALLMLTSLCQQLVSTNEFLYVD